MNSQNQSKKVDVEINPENPPSPSNPLSQRFRVIAIQLKEWFISLPLVGRIVVGVVGVSMAFSLLNLVLQAIVSLVSTAILVIILYILYRTFIASRSSS